jgi:hypothetical protein
MLDHPPPFTVVHECCALGNARWEFIGTECPKRLPSDSLLRLLVSRFTNAIEIDTE